MKIFGWIFVGLVSLVLLFGALFGLTWLGIEWRGFFAEKQKNVERRVFEQTKSYNHGMIQDLANYRYQYVTAEDEQEKQAIASVVRQRFAAFDIESVQNNELKEFWYQINR